VFDHAMDAGKKITLGYPVLRRLGKEMREAGVAFTDLTGIFDRLNGKPYHDSCCHMNALGNEIMGKRIGEIILQDIRKNPL